MRTALWPAQPRASRAPATLQAAAPHPPVAPRLVHPDVPNATAQRPRRRARSTHLRCRHGTPHTTTHHHRPTPAVVANGAQHTARSTTSRPSPPQPHPHAHAAPWPAQPGSPRPEAPRARRGRRRAGTLEPARMHLPRPRVRPQQGHLGGRRAPRGRRPRLPRRQGGGAASASPAAPWPQRLGTGDGASRVWNPARTSPTPHGPATLAAAHSVGAGTAGAPLRSPRRTPTAPTKPETPAPGGHPTRRRRPHRLGRAVRPEPHGPAKGVGDHRRAHRRAAGRVVATHGPGPPPRAHRPGLPTQ